MDESSLSTLGSLLTFTHADVVKGIMCTPRYNNSGSKDSYLVRILRLLGKEIIAIREFEWKVMQQKGRLPGFSGKNNSKIAGSSNSSQNNSTSNEQASTPWKQHLVPQDDSLPSRKLRRRGCLSFLREMFNMVRMSLQQSDKDDFYAMIVLMDVSMNETFKEHNNGVNPTKISLTGHGDTVNLLSLLGSILSDTNADVSERAACLDILSAIAIHEPSLIRKHCLDEFSSSKGMVDENNYFKRRLSKVIRPEPDDKYQVIFVCPPSDLLLSLLGLMATENDAGIILETCEVIRIILDTEIMNDTTQMDLGGVIDNEEDELIGSDNTSFLVGTNAQNGHNGGGCELNSFLQIFYDHYVPWLVAPFQYSLLVPKTAIPFSINHGEMNENESLLQFIKRKHQDLVDHKKSRTGLLKMVSTSAVRLSFSVELLSFCIRAHCYR
jgi:protein phosphatase-4 regulatory subunit 3